MFCTMCNDNQEYNRWLNCGNHEFLQEPYKSKLQSEQKNGSQYVEKTNKAKTKRNSSTNKNNLHENYRTERSRKIALEKEYIDIQILNRKQSEDILILRKQNQQLVAKINAQTNKLQQNKLKEMMLLEECKRSAKVVGKLESAILGENELRNTPFKNSNDRATKQRYKSAPNPSLPLPHNFEPEQHVLERLRMFHGVPIEFTQQQLVEFTTYYQDTGDKRRSWQNSFLKWVVRAWEQTACNPKSFISPSFYPSNEACEILLQEKIPCDFYTKQIRSFVLHWRERGEKHNTWDSKFINFVKIAWQTEKTAGTSIEKKQRRHQTMYERLTDDSWATDGIQLAEHNWGEYKG